MEEIDNGFFEGFETISVSPTSSALIAYKSPTVFREDADDTPAVIAPGYEYMRWGRDNLMPYNVIKTIEDDETLSTCMQFNSEICYAGGLVFNTDDCTKEVQGEIEDFTRLNGMQRYYMGICQDLKYFAFAISVVYLNENGTVARIARKHAAYCRFAPKDKNGKIPYILYGNWRKNIASKDEVEKIELLSIDFPLEDILVKTGKRMDSSFKKNVSSCRKYAIATVIPTPDSTYYPIPPYAPLFKGKWFTIKQLIGIAKEASLRNSSPIRYLIEVSSKHFDRIAKMKGITDIAKKKEMIKEEKQKIIDYLTGAENSNKALFADYLTTADGKEMHEVKITQVDAGKTQGGDWSQDMAEAVNMICFAMRVHSNLVGSVPGKAQMNNSGSDKRELYTIAQALQKPYHDVFFCVPYLIIEVNNWKGAKPDCPFIQLTTLDENKDAKMVTTNNSQKNGDNK